MYQRNILFGFACILTIFVVSNHATAVDDASVRVDGNNMEMAVGGAKLTITGCSGSSATPSPPAQMASDTYVSNQISMAKESSTKMEEMQKNATVDTIVATLSALSTARSTQISSMSAQASQAAEFVSAFTSSNVVATQDFVSSKISTLQSTLKDLINTQAGSTASTLASLVETLNTPQLSVLASVAQSADKAAFLAAMFQNTTFATKGFVSSSVQTLSDDLSNAIDGSKSSALDTVASKINAAVSSFSTLASDTLSTATTQAVSSILPNITDALSGVVSNAATIADLSSTVAATDADTTTLENSLSTTSGSHVTYQGTLNGLVSGIGSDITDEVNRAIAAETSNANNIADMVAKVSKIRGCNENGQVYKTSTDSCVEPTYPTSCNAALTGITRYSTADNVLQYCDGANWKSTVYGSDGNPGTSCSDIYSKSSSSRGVNGLYYLKDGSGNVLPVYCDMADGGYTLVAMISSNSGSVWNYDNARWTDTSTLNPTLTDYNSDNNMKNVFFSSLGFNSFRLRMMSLTDGDALTRAHSANSMRDMFAGGSFGITNDRNVWFNMADVSSGDFNDQPNCNAAYVNYNNGGSKCRAGNQMNNENDCNTNDSFIGFGCQVGSIQIGAGARAWQSGNQYSRKGYIFVK